MAATDAPPPTDYESRLDDLRQQVRTAQAAAMQGANTEMLALYRSIGRSLLERAADGSSAEVLHQVSAELRARFRDSIAFTPGNLDYMRRFAEAWPDPAATPALTHLPWGHIRLLLDAVRDPQPRDWYVAATVKHGWSENVLQNQILSQAHLRGLGDERSDRC